MRGDGTIYKRGPVYWYSYYVNGQQERESLKTTDEQTAKKRARKIRDGLLQGTIFAVSQRRVTVGELLDDVKTHLVSNQRAWARNAGYCIERLREHFGHLPWSKFETQSYLDFQKHCREELKLAPATIDRHGELLRQAFKMGFERTPPKVARRPLIPLLRENNARQGFVAVDTFWKINAAISDVDLQDYLEWFWWTGMRPIEIARMTWSMLDDETETLHLAPRAAKTRKPRLIPLLGPDGERTPVYEIIERRRARRITDNPFIFHRFGGRPVKWYLDSWATACRAVGLKYGRKVEGGLTPYDLRRSAVRNHVRGGTDFSTVMEISGHVTRSTFDRYNITSGDDVAAAMVRTADYAARLRETRAKASHRTNRTG